MTAGWRYELAHAWRVEFRRTKTTKEPAEVCTNVVVVKRNVRNARISDEEYIRLAGEDCIIYII